MQKELNKISPEKLEWLKSIGVIDIRNFDYMIMSNGHLYSKEYLNSKTLEEIKTEYRGIYPLLKVKRTRLSDKEIREIDKKIIEGYLTPFVVSLVTTILILKLLGRI